MVLLVTSTSGSNGAGYGKLLAFNETGQLLGPFTEDTRISDPRGLGVDDGLHPGARWQGPGGTR